MGGTTPMGEAVFSSIGSSSGSGGKGDGGTIMLANIPAALLPGPLIPVAMNELTEMLLFTG